MDSQQKTAVVTGSSSGIGRAISQDLLSHGYKVIGLARDHKKFDPECKHYFPYEIDLTDFDRTVSLLKSCLLYTSPSPRDLSTSRMPSSA